MSATRRAVAHPHFWHSFVAQNRPLSIGSATVGNAVATVRNSPQQCATVAPRNSRNSPLRVPQSCCTSSLAQRRAPIAFGSAPAREKKGAEFKLINAASGLDARRLHHVESISGREAERTDDAKLSCFMPLIARSHSQERPHDQQSAVFAATFGSSNADITALKAANTGVYRACEAYPWSKPMAQPAQKAPGGLALRFRRQSEAGPENELAPLSLLLAMSACPEFIRTPSRQNFQHSECPNVGRTVRCRFRANVSEFFSQLGGRVMAKVIRKNGLQVEGSTVDVRPIRAPQRGVMSAAELHAHQEASVRPVSRSEQRRLGRNIRAKYQPPTE